MYNLDQIVSIRVIGVRPSSWYTFKRECKFLGIRWRHAGIYDAFGAYIGTEPPDNHVLIDGVVCVKPHVRIHYSNEDWTDKFFDTVDEATAYRDRITSKGRWE